MGELTADNNDNQKIVMDTISMSQIRYKTYVDEIAKRIYSGELQPGTRLLTHRAFAKQEKVSLVTASRIYKELIAQGLISGEMGRGTFVRDISLLPTSSIEHEATPNMLDLNFVYPAITTQTELLRSTLKQLTNGSDLEGLLHYLPHAGRHHERMAIAQHLSLRGLKSVDPETVVMVSGAQHGLATVVLAMFNPGDVIAVDALTYPGFKALAQTYHIDLVAIPITADGPNLAALEQLSRQRNIRGYFTMPTLHNPLGWGMDLASRKILVNLARKYHFWLIEDGSYAFLQHKAPLPLAMLAPDITFYVSGFSKNIATGLRVGMVVAPLKYIADLEKVIRITTWNTPALSTAIIFDWLEKGEVEKLECKKRNEAKKRQNIVQRIFADIPYISHPNSYFIWIPLPEGVRYEAVISTLRNANIMVSSAESYAVTSAIPQAIRVAISTLPLPNLELALNTIKSVITHFIDL